MGIGANTAIFSLVDALLLRWLPVANPQELVRVQLQSPRATTHPVDSLSYPIVAALAARPDVFAHVCGFSTATFDSGPPGATSKIHAAWMTGDCFATFGLTPALGRLLGNADDQPGAPPAAVIGYGYWERAFARSPEVLGRLMYLDGHPVTIIGVAPRGFDGATVGDVADITIAVASLPQLNPQGAGLLGPGNSWIWVLARPLPGASIAGTEAHLTTVWRQISDGLISPRWPPGRRQEMANSTFVLSPGGTGYSYLRRVFTRPLLVLMGVAGLVLLIACANVASLLLARAAARRREIAVRLAIGASRGRVIRQLLTESVLLSCVGAAAGIGLAWIGAGLLVRTLAGGGMPVNFDLTPDWRVLGFACALALINGVIFGLAPAFRATAIDGNARATAPHARILSSLVSAQVALSMLLLVAAGLFVGTLENLLHLDLGFRSEGVLMVELNGAREGYTADQLPAFYAGLLERVRQIPGVTSASLSSHTPLSGSTWSEAAVPKGQTLPERDTALFTAVTPDFFTAIGTPLISGRTFDTRDQGAISVAIINQSYAARYFPGQNPIGRYLTATLSRPPSDLEIVGVAHDSLTSNVRGHAIPAIYVPYLQRGAGYDDSVVVRASGSLAAAANALHAVLQPSFRQSPIEVQALTDRVAGTLVQERLMAKLGAGFGILGLLLACAGLYGLLAYTVVRRTKEIGIRMALGAQRQTVLTMIAARALRLIAIGVVAGAPIAWLLSRSVQSLLFGLKSTDTTVFAAAAALLAIAGLIAAYFPARRAAAVDPATALRDE